jgi:hypothetical protein
MFHAQQNNVGSKDERKKSCYTFDGTSPRYKVKLYPRTKFLEKRLSYKPHKRRFHSGLIADYPLWSPFSCLSGDKIGGSWTLHGVLGCYYVGDQSGFFASGCSY